MKIRKFNESVDEETKIFNSIKSIFIGISDENDNINLTFRKYYNVHAFTNPELEIVIDIHIQGSKDHSLSNILSFSSGQECNKISKIKEIIDNSKRITNILSEIESYLKIVNDDGYNWIISTDRIIEGHIRVIIKTNFRKEII